MWHGANGGCVVAPHSRHLFSALLGIILLWSILVWSVSTSCNFICCYRNQLSTQSNCRGCYKKHEERPQEQPGETSTTAVAREDSNWWWSTQTKFPAALLWDRLAKSCNTMCHGFSATNHLLRKTCLQPLLWSDRAVHSLMATHFYPTCTTSSGI